MREEIIKFLINKGYTREEVYYAFGLTDSQNIKNLKAPRWTKEEKSQLEGLSIITPQVLDNLKELIPNRSRGAIFSAIKRYVPDYKWVGDNEST